MTKRALLFSSMLLATGVVGQTALAAEPSHQLTLSEADKLITLPLHCVETPYPYKTGIVPPMAIGRSSPYCVSFLIWSMPPRHAQS